MRRLLPVAAFHLSLVLRRVIGVGTPRGLPNRWNHLVFSVWLVGMVLEKPSGTVRFVSKPLQRADSGFHPCRTRLCAPLAKRHFHHGLLAVLEKVEPPT